MRELLLVCGHALVSTAFMLMAGRYAGSRPGDAVSLSYLVFQLVAALTIVLVARRQYRLPVAVFAVLLVGWGAMCSFLAAMSLSGNWL